jgi:hypothetical protein
MVDEPLTTESLASPASGQYRSLSAAAVVSLVLGVLSILTALWWVLAIIPIAGIAVGWLAIQQIRKAPEERTGLSLAQWGIGVSVGLWVLGYGWMFFRGTSEVPYGYTRITFDTLEAAFATSPTDMNDKKVYLKGYMKPGRRQTAIKEFVMGPSAGDCKFCSGTPKPTEMIRVVLQGNATTAFTTRQIGVAGRLRVDLASPDGLPYSIDAESVR